MSTFAVFAVSFILRPIGAVLWGNWGDRFGRRWALSWSILFMSGSTFLIAFLPGYAAIGIAAPGLLLRLRMVQGFSASGEYAGAATFLSEYAPANKRGMYTSLVPASTAAGLLFGSLFVTVLVVSTSDAAMESWGWRLPFLLAGPLGLIGRYIRVHLEDSPAYRRLSEGATPTTISLTVYIGSIFLLGHISDRIGRRRMLLTACVLFIVLTMNDGTLATFLAEMFPTSVRYTGFAVSFNTANALFGGTAPFVATWLIDVTGSVMAPAWYLVIVSALALTAMFGTRETAFRALRET